MYEITWVTQFENSNITLYFTMHEITWVTQFENLKTLISPLIVLEDKRCT